jgi:hypothetical protein
MHGYETCKEKYVTCVPEAHGQHDEFFPELLKDECHVLGCSIVKNYT